MKITKICLIDDKNTVELEKLNRLMAVFCTAFRYSFNRLIEGEQSGKLIKMVNALFRLNKRYAEDAVMQAQAILSSQKELLPSRIEGVQGKIKKTCKKIEDYQTGKKRPKKVSLEVCLIGLNARLEKLQLKESCLLKHQEDQTIPTVIFGGKKNFYERLKGTISNDEWKDLRSNTLYSRGDKSKKGNLNTRIVFDEKEQQLFIEVANPLQVEGRKKSPRLRFKLHVSDKYFNEMVEVVLPNEVGKTSKSNPFEEYKPYSIELKRKNGKVYVHITYDEEAHGSVLNWNEKIQSDIVAGVDVNVDRVAISILTKQGNLLDSKTFYCHEIEYVKSNRSSNISGELAKDIVQYLLSWNVGAMVLEDIKLKQDHDTNKLFNRRVHSFAKTKLQKAIISRGLRNGFKIKKVNPAYTSVIGRFKYSKKYGLSVHEAASFVIGRRGLDFDEKIPQELLNHLRTIVKPKLISLLGSMEESETKSNNGKQRRKFMGMMVTNIETFKVNHRWKLWNVIHKTLMMKNQEIQFKVV
ncbi:IS200/IS605 family accessory protein TnpB-related protein [Neobacillus novalis]|uniref:IS200/IS605 family accessory protein TnpB-related protein n=1 Tax=Neobacillus novalis TaxID=220687 RepID=A0AA95SF06_9BACI|nr:IS200/IS605 family accessory protein TnpB-related protein [Neobacillus novalis]WHY84806.1 IS200/IS605 family accessory protein TnpB-related protein [Neobacillus novalis]